MTRRSCAHLLAARPVLRRADAPLGAVRRPILPSSASVSLMAAHQCHPCRSCSRMSRSTSVVLAVPVMLADPATETALAMVRRVLVSAPDRAVADSSAESERTAGS